MCSKCNGLGFITHIDELGYETITKCTCKVNQELENKLIKSGLDRFKEEYTFDNFVVTHKWQGIAKQIAQRYANEPNGWLVLLGQSGAGKSHLGVSAMRDIIEREGVDAEYILWTDLMNEVFNDFYKLNKESYRRLTQVDLLYIDDLFKHKDMKDITRQEFDVAHSILNSRYVNMKKTIISSEWILADIFKLDEALARRIKNMSENSVVQIGKDTNKNYDLTKGK